ncbi:hypothetical protein R3P38DRAFT_3234171 [Favolaschia claudopus]|uniref:Uncharacterized protein n=1 Tax=Favolaschia claudopus TaxID=2862362 RepID=A0AAV9ZH98_9AGAR
MAPPSSLFLTPRLRDYDDDAEIFMSEPFASAFKDCLSIRQKDYPKYLLGQLSQTLNQRHYVELLETWLILRVFTLGLIAVEKLTDDARNEPEAQKLFLESVARPGTLLETNHPNIERSFRLYNWRTVYAELICDWVKPTISMEEYLKSLPTPDPHYKFTSSDAEDLIMFIGVERRIQPWTSNPMGAYLFFSQDCFEHNCETWLVPSLRTLGYEARYQLTELAAYMEEPSAAEPKDSFPLLEYTRIEIDPRFLTVIRETAKHRAAIDSVWAELYRPLPQPVNFVEQQQQHPSWDAAGAGAARRLSKKAATAGKPVSAGQKAKQEVLGLQTVKIVSRRSAIETQDP